MKQYKNSYYEVSEDGKVFNIKNGKERKTQLVNGFYQVVLFLKKSAKFIYVHHLVAETYVPNPEGFKCVKHKDGNPSNNHYTNLEWCSKDETYKKGVKHKKFKLEQVQYIHKNYTDGTYNQTELADMFGVKQGYISYLLKRYELGKIKI
jgi:hypothetical protein